MPTVRVRPGILLVVAVGAWTGCAGPLPNKGPSPFAPTPPVRDLAAVRPAARETLLGLLCTGGPTPRLHVIAARQVGWRSAPAELRKPVQLGVTRPFAALSPSGGRGGVFSGIGVSDPATVEIGGGYAGAAPCPPDDAGCAAARRGCMLAVADLSATDTETPPALEARGACLVDGALVVDVDGDGTDEIFDARGLAARPDGLGPRQGGAEARCHKTIVAAWPDDVALLGVLDLDADGRAEVVLRVADQILVYSALGSPGVLDKVVDRALPATPGA